MYHYYIWTIGCQMNTADSSKIAEILLSRGFEPVQAMDKADLIVVNSCVVREKAENKALALIDSLKSLHKNKSGLSVAVTGCLVDSNIKQLREQLPHVSLFFRPQDFQVFEQWLGNYPLSSGTSTERDELRNSRISDSPIALIPVIKGCNSFCSYCIVPYRRGREVSRSIDDIVKEANNLTACGIREITLLGQTVDSYGSDLPGSPDLADLLVQLEEIHDLYRIRFLTSHPGFFKERLIHTMSRLSKVCPFFSLPVQSGDDNILKLMRRGYTTQDYRNLIKSIRNTLKVSAISTDIIVGFPDEREANFQNTVKLLEELRFDTIHVAVYSPRRGTLAEREMKDNVPLEEKKKRLQTVEEINKRVSGEINSLLLNSSVEVLVESERKGKWQGRTVTNKLVFFPGPVNLTGRLVKVKIVKTSPWSLTGIMEGIIN